MTAKCDDQNAFENGYSCECVGRYEQAIRWYAEVKPTGERWDVSAVAATIAILVAVGRAGEAVHICTAALSRMKQPSILLVGEVSRAWNAYRGPAHALSVCQAWATDKAISNSIEYWHFTAAYASLSGQFALSLQGLLAWVQLRHLQSPCDILLDMDFAPLWQHLEADELTDEEVRLLSSPLWPDDSEVLTVHSGALSFESYTHVPPRLRSMLCVETASMTWIPRAKTPAPLLRAYAAWRKETRRKHFESFLVGRRKAVAFKSSIRTE